MSIPALDAGGIDAAIRAAWLGAGITPAERVDDAGFLRRATLDITGTLPTPEAVNAFVAEASPDKRARAVDALLSSSGYADRWTDAWEDLLLDDVQSPVVDRGAFRRWLRAELEANTPWDKLVRALITATGRNSVGGARTAMGSPDSDADTDAAAGVNGAVNWLLAYQRSPQDLPASASRLFLGVQIQCAQCHDHKTEKWTQGDFRSFAACFAEVQTRPAGERPDKGVRPVEVLDGDRPRKAGRKSPDREALAAIAAAPPRTLDGTDLSGTDNRRQALASWIVAPQNPWFARAIVNRMWATFVGRGFVEPVDDLRPGNAPVLPALFDRLAQDFIQSGYDLKHLIRTIAATEVYQLADAPAAGPQGKPIDDALWPRFRARPMPPDVLLNAIIAATGLTPVLDRIAGARRDQIMTQMRQGFSFLFDVDEDTAKADVEGTIPQALLLLNGAISAAGTSAAIQGAALNDVLASPGNDAQKIEAIYLRTLSRTPTPAELDRWTRYVTAAREPTSTLPPEDAPPARGGRRTRVGNVDLPPRLEKRLYAHPGTAKEQAYEDIFWALLNSSEFFYNH